MALFKRDADLTAGIADTIKERLAPKDGNTHYLMLNTWSTWGTTKFRIDDKYVTELEEALNTIKSQGYEIIKVSHDSMSDGTGFAVVTYTTLIAYR